MKKSLLILSLLCFLELFSLKAEAVLYDSGKPFFVEISTDWCHACNTLKPTIEELKNEYGFQVNFIRLNLSNNESRLQANAIAAELGLSFFLANNSRAFPTVGILCSSGSQAEQTIIGAHGKSTYRQVLNGLLNKGQTCDLNTISEEDKGPGRPDEVDFEDTEGAGRPDVIANNGGRPKGFSHSGRPTPLKFYTVGEEIPYHAYFNYMRLPKCGNGLNVICSNYFDINTTPIQIQASAPPAKPATFSPYTPFATRDEKGLKSASITKKKKRKKK